MRQPDQARSLFPLGILLFLFTALTTCTDERAVIEITDVIRDVPFDAALPPLNSCGGLTELSWEGGDARPGEPCGPCEDGVLACANAEQLDCLDARPLNECGGCLELAAEPSTLCGSCNFGEMVCNEDGGLTCLGDRPPNSCGGCTMLPAAPGDECGTEREPATWLCVSPDEVRCVPDSTNACGGMSELDGAVGTLCGSCGRGSLACEGTDALICLNADLGLNACGGCKPLTSSPGEPCGECGGFWQCSQENLVCSIDRNACGGCGPLEGEPGEPCSGGTWICTLGAGVDCVDLDRNACGGETQLANPPGRPCGECLDGRYTCVDPENTVCIGATDHNACGTCGLLDGEPGEPCAPNAAWICSGGQAACSSDIGVNPCGGTMTLTGVPGDPCGPCDSGALVCAGANNLICQGASDESELSYWIDADTDGFGDAEADAEIFCEPPASGYVQDNTDCNDDNPLAYPQAPEDPCSATEDLNCDGVITIIDGDGDGSPTCLDCDDGNRARYPDNTEICDAIDNDCDGEVDEDTGFLWYRDSDGDRHGNPDLSLRACARPEGYVASADDCDDQDMYRYPNKPELCDGIDNDCDGTVDGEDAVDRSQWWPDADGDGFGDPRFAFVLACDAPEGFAGNADDCRDDDPLVHPDAQEVCDGADNNCDQVVDSDAIDRVTLFVDQDGDGYGDPLNNILACDQPGLVEDGSDCDDGRTDTHPGAYEIPGDGADQTCDGTETCFIDADRDGFIVGFGITVQSTDLTCASQVACPEGTTPPPGSVQCWLNPGRLPLIDCDDTDPTTFPGAVEGIGDSRDQNCDGTEVCYRDADNDGYRPSAEAIILSLDTDCIDDGEALATDLQGDCWDKGDPVTFSTPLDPETSNPPLPSTTVTVAPENLHPGSTESGEYALHGVDYNCDGSALCYFDRDGDGFRSAAPPAPEDTVLSPNYLSMCAIAYRASYFEVQEYDRCDSRGDVYPGHTDTAGQIADGIDQDCDGSEVCYKDVDHDSYRTNSTQTVTSETAVVNLCNWTTANKVAPRTAALDCNDDDASIHPGAADEPDIGATAAPYIVDSNCDGRDGIEGVDRYVTCCADANEDGICDGTTTTTRDQIQAALDACRYPPRCNVLLATGDCHLNEPLYLRGGVDVFGGYRNTFSERWYGRNTGAGWDVEFGDASDNATVLHATSATTQTLRAVDITSATVVEGFRIEGPNPSTSGETSYAVWLNNSPGLDIRRSRIVGGQGAAGYDAPADRPGAGNNAGNASGQVGGLSYCDRTYYWTGGWGAGECDPYYDRDPDPDICICNPAYYPNSGNAGGDPTSGGEWGGNGANECERKCDHAACNANEEITNGYPGYPGYNGACGSGGTAVADTLGRLVNGYFRFAGSPGAGGRGYFGTGGGGGGHGGGYYCDDYSGTGCGEAHDVDNSGGYGGGGGGGGCYGNGGQAGGHGGASFAIMAFNSPIDVIDVTIVMGQGGRGGHGQPGADGGKGGAGASGGAGEGSGDEQAKPGGAGNSGGHGGGGGGGAGGNGGPVFGIGYYGNAPRPNQHTLDRITGGTPGAIGNGGDSGSVGRGAATCPDTADGWNGYRQTVPEVTYEFH